MAASVLAFIGAAAMGTSLLGGTTLQAAAVGTTGHDYSKIFIWAGVGFLVVSALLFISASAE